MIDKDLEIGKLYRCIKDGSILDHNDVVMPIKYINNKSNWSANRIKEILFLCCKSKTLVTWRLRTPSKDGIHELFLFIKRLD